MTSRVALVRTVRSHERQGERSVDTPKYKEPVLMLAQLGGALKAERRKLEATPVEQDMAPVAEHWQAWGSVVAGYSLLEQALKAILNLRDKKPKKTHALLDLFRRLPEEYQVILYRHYDDFLEFAPRMDQFPFRLLRDFLGGLDGERGFSDWRYFLIEEEQEPLPVISLEVIHELVNGCLLLFESIWRGEGNPRDGLYSVRLARDRWYRHRDWAQSFLGTIREHQQDEIVLLWGPDDAGRYDYIMCTGQLVLRVLAPFPSDCEMRVVDRREELRETAPQ